jgi:hypothetical protein
VLLPNPFIRDEPPREFLVYTRNSYNKGKVEELEQYLRSQSNDVETFHEISNAGVTSGE